MSKRALSIQLNFGQFLTTWGVSTQSIDLQYREKKQIERENVEKSQNLEKFQNSSILTIFCYSCKFVQFFSIMNELSL